MIDLITEKEMCKIFEKEYGVDLRKYYSYNRYDTLFNIVANLLNRIEELENDKKK